ncbi:hypothetical protein [Bacillus sp. 1006-3]|uniref:hypothetical protein n=1 Tax=Bacillus sp. 1006-3 TaxID=2922309 RepID=UPI001F113D7E|nr:hypothetical protein [Bacillus sp. 1006-3]MCH4866826.1 hypothetical protein [Bacillus sp. 1006-3]
MDPKEFEQRILGEEINLEAAEKDRDPEAILMLLESMPYKESLPRIASIIESDTANKKGLPFYLKAGEYSGTTMDIGYVNLTMEKWHQIESVLYLFNPKFYRLEENRVTEIKKEDMVGTIKFKEGTDVDAII